MSRWRLQQNDLSIQALPAQGCTVQTLPVEYGEGRSTTQAFSDDFTLIETRFLTNRDLSIATRIELDEPRMVITLGMRGQSAYVQTRAASVLFNPQTTTVNCFGASRGERQYRAGEEVVQLRFSISQSWLRNQMGEMEADLLFQPKQLVHWGTRPTSTSASLNARQLLARNGHGGLKRLLAQGCAMSIIADELNVLLKDRRQRHGATSAEDRALAERVKDRLENAYSDPPQLAELAASLNITPFKLQTVFQGYYQVTPYAYVAELRMRQALHLLEHGQASVAGVAEMLGYRHVGNFSAAFGKFFGFPPSKILRQRRKRRHD